MEVCEHSVPKFVPHKVLWVKNRAKRWFKKHIDSGNAKGIEKMIKRGTVVVTNP